MKAQRTYSSERNGKSGLSGFTSMIDVVFLLLIFFLCAAKFPDPEARLRQWLPQQGQGEDPFVPPTPRLLLSMDDAQGACRCLRTDIRSETGFSAFPEQTIQDPVTKQKETIPDWNAVARYLHTVKKNRDSGLESEVVVDLEQKVPWKHVVTLLDRCKEAGIETIGFAVPHDMF